MFTNMDIYPNSSEYKYLRNDKIRLILHESGLNALQLAQKIDVSRSTLSHILAYRNKPSHEILERIMRWNPKYSFDWFSRATPEELQLMKELADNQGYGQQKARLDTAPELNERKPLDRIPVLNDSRGTQHSRPTPRLAPEVAAALPTTVTKTKPRKAIMITIHYDDNTTQMIHVDPKLNQLLSGEAKS